MQRWTFPSFRLPTGTTNSQPKSIHPKPTHHTQVEAHTHSRNNNQAYNTSPKHTHIERTLRFRITKQKAQNEQLRKNIATLEAQSAYLGRLKELEQEVDQLKKEGRKLARREKEVKRVLEEDEQRVEGAVRWDGLEELHAKEDDGGDEDGRDICRDWASDEVSSGFREGSVGAELRDWEETLLASLLSREEETRSIDEDEDEDKRKIKQEVEVEVKDPMGKWIEELELSRGAEAWK